MFQEVDHQQALRILNSFGAPACLVNVDQDHSYSYVALNQLAETYYELADSDIAGMKFSADDVSSAWAWDDDLHNAPPSLADLDDGVG